MSAPETNVDKQKKRHAGPIIGISAGLVFVAIILVAYLVYTSSPSTEGDDPVPDTIQEQATPADVPAPQDNAPPSDSETPATR